MASQVMRDVERKRSDTAFEVQKGTLTQKGPPEGGPFRSTRPGHLPASVVQAVVSFSSSRAEPAATNVTPVAVWMARMVVV